MFSNQENVCEDGNVQARASSLSMPLATRRSAPPRLAAVEPDQLARRLQRDSGLGAAGRLVFCTNSGTKLLTQVAWSLCNGFVLWDPRARPQFKAG